MSKKNKMPRDKKLRSNGYMTIDEFLIKFTFGLREHVYNTWSNSGTDDLHHPEDLAAHALTYAENVFQVVGIFGVANTNEEE